jgi:hypothetical protein
MGQDREEPRERLSTGLCRENALRLLWLSAYALAMAYVEAAVVAYLRLLAPGQAFDAPQAAVADALPLHVVRIEIGREAATLVMLAAVACLAARKGWWQRLGYLLWVFAVWDVLYYAWLRVLIAWPPSFMTMDVLFLIPFVWAAPVVFPLAVSGVMVVLALVILRRA